MPRLFFPTARAWNLLIALGLLSLGYAIYLRYIVMEQAWVALSCQDGASTWVCLTRNAAIALSTKWVFGALGLAAGVHKMIRPSLLLLGIGELAPAWRIA